MNVDKDTCIGCGACAGVCPVEALAFDDEGKMEVKHVLELVQ